MYLHFLKYLADPKTGESLGVENEKGIKIQTDDSSDVTEGWLVSPSNRYPIVRGIPRFAGYKDDANYTKSFGYQWNRWSKIQFDSENVGRPMAGHTEKMWRKITGTTAQDLHGAVVADFGCGPGRFLATVREKNGIAIGLDYSDAVEAAAENFHGDKNVLVCQADILHAPLKTSSIDSVFSIGVLHHTANPRHGLREMIRVTKPGGSISVSVYGKGGYYDNFFVTIYRKIFNTLWPIFGHYPPLIYSYAVVYITWPILKIPIVRTLIRPFLYFFPFIHLQDIRWSVLDTFDSVTPTNQSGHTPHEVFQWLKAEKLLDIEPSDWGGASFFAKKALH